MTDHYCYGCSCDLGYHDCDPNGDWPSCCKQCQAEEEHDFDAEPNVRFNRLGHRIELPEIKKFNAVLFANLVISTAKTFEFQRLTAAQQRSKIEELLKL